MSTRTDSLPEALIGLVDDAAVFPPGNAPLPDAVRAHRAHRSAWYAPMVGPLLFPASAAAELAALLRSHGPIGTVLIGDAGLDNVADALALVPAGQVEIAVARPGEDPVAGLRALLDRMAAWPDVSVAAEIPRGTGTLAALDLLMEVGEPQPTPKFRTGGLSAELFPSPAELAGLIVACRDRGLRFKATAGLHRAIRHTDPATGSTHHGFLNILAACGAPGDEADVLAETDPAPVVAAVRAMLPEPRPLWTGFGTCSIIEPLDDLVVLGMLEAV